MAKKPKRGAPAIDMTAMVDVAFLLLTFFILTTTRFREESKVEVDMPSSISDIDVPDKGLCTISLDNEGKIFVGFSDIGTRDAVLQRFMQEKEVTINQAGVNYFSNLQEFGVAHKDFSKWLNEEGGDVIMEDFPHNGISARVTDSTNMSGNDLKDWIRWGRISDQRMRFAIKGDVSTNYTPVEDAISSLQDWDVNQFVLITNLEEGGLVEIGD